MEYVYFTTMLLLILKLAGLIQISWWFVFMPVIISFGAFLACLITIIILAWPE